MPELPGHDPQCRGCQSCWGDVLEAQGEDAHSGSEQPALDLEAARERERAASLEVARLCKGGRWTMRVPARPDADSDEVIGASLADVPALLAEVERLQRERDQWKAEALRAQEERTDLIADLRDMRSDGDGLESTMRTSAGARMSKWVARLTRGRDQARTDPAATRPDATQDPSPAELVRMQGAINAMHDRMDGAEQQVQAAGLAAQLAHGRLDRRDELTPRIAALEDRIGNLIPEVRDLQTWRTRTATRLGQLAEQMDADREHVSHTQERITALEQQDKPSPHQITVDLSGADRDDVERLLRNWVRLQGQQPNRTLHDEVRTALHRRPTPQDDDHAAAEEGGTHE